MKKFFDTIPDIEKEGLSVEFFYTAAGCDKCNHTGYKGRIGVFEAIKTNREIEDVVGRNPSEREIEALLKYRPDSMS